MRLRWKREVIPPMSVSTKQLELEAAKQILSEVFHVHPADVEDMIQRGLEERDWPEGREDRLWPAEFCLGGE